MAAHYRSTVGDPTARRGVRHGFVAVPAIGVRAVLAMPRRTAAVGGRR